MHIVSTTTALFMGPSLGELPAGRWLCSDANAFELAMIAPRGTVKLHDPSWLPWKDVFHDGMSIVFIRSGAIGDLLFLTPALEAFKIKYPKSRVGLSCFEKHHHLFKATGPELFDDLLPYPLPLDYMEQFQKAVSLENVVELAGSKHATDAFAEALGVTVTIYYPSYHVLEQEREWAACSLPKGDKPRVALQLRASVRNRDYPMAQWNEVISGLVGRGWEVLLYGSKGQVPPLPKGSPAEVIDCSSMTFREAAAVLETCDAFCGVDSAFVNLCPALGVPAIGLYGPFPWQSRTSHAPKTLALSGVGECAGCCWAPQAGRHFPPTMECAKTGVCSVLASIEPKRIIAKVDALRPVNAQ